MTVCGMTGRSTDPPFLSPARVQTQPGMLFNFQSTLMINRKPIPTIGQRIAVARKAAELTQKGLGERLGVATATVSRWECGAIDPPASTLDKIAEATGHRLELTR